MRMSVAWAQSLLSDAYRAKVIARDILDNWDRLSKIEKLDALNLLEGHLTIVHRGLQVMASPKTETAEIVNGSAN